ncbi:MAG: hypothetical protein ACREM6_15080, partial [Vulcanimicrobiaceae bacterium]
MEMQSFQSRDVLVRVADFRDRGGDVRLRSSEWGLLFAIDGSTPLGDLADRLQLDLDTACELAQKFELAGLIVPVQMSLGDYLTY